MESPPLSPGDYGNAESSVAVDEEVRLTNYNTLTHFHLMIKERPGLSFIADLTQTPSLSNSLGWSNWSSAGFTFGQPADAESSGVFIPVINHTTTGNVPRNREYASYFLPHTFRGNERFYVRFSFEENTKAEGAFIGLAMRVNGILWYNAERCCPLTRKGITSQDDWSTLVAPSAMSWYPDNYGEPPRLEIHHDTSVMFANTDPIPEKGMFHCSPVPINSLCSPSSRRERTGCC